MLVVEMTRIMRHKLSKKTVSQKNFLSCGMSSQLCSEMLRKDKGREEIQRDRGNKEEKQRNIVSGTGKER